jgi:hypothetical protein
MAKAKGTIQSSPSLDMSGRIAKHHCGRQGTRSRDSTSRRAVVDRRNVTEALTADYKRGHTENMRSRFMELQGLIETRARP